MKAFSINMFALVFILVNISCEKNEVSIPTETEPQKTDSQIPLTEQEKAVVSESIFGFTFIGEPRPGFISVIGIKEIISFFRGSKSNGIVNIPGFTEGNINTADFFTAGFIAKLILKYKNNFGIIHIES